MRLRNHILILVILLPAVCSAQLGFNIARGKRSVKFPIELCNNLVVVPVVLNGQLPLKFILDTGVRTTILTEKTFSDILKLTYNRRYLIAGPGGEKLVEAYVTTNVTLDLPGIHGEGHAMLVLEKDYLELRNYLGTDVQGVLGYEIFSRFIVEINYERKLLTITQPEFFHPKRNYQVLHISVEDTKPYITVPVELNDNTTIQAKLMVDSGASHGLVLDPKSNEKIIVPEKHVSSLIGRGIGGVILGQIARIKSLDLGTYHFRDLIANFPDGNSYIDTLKASDVYRNGSVGGEILSRFTTVYNFPQEKLYLRKNTSFNKKFNYNMTGITLKAKGSRLRKYEITDVRKDSPADKSGVQSGDEVIMVNGLPAADMDLNSINSYFNSKPGKRVKLELLRDGQRLIMLVPLESQI